MTQYTDEELIEAFMCLQQARNIIGKKLINRSITIAVRKEGMLVQFLFKPEFVFTKTITISSD